MSTVQEIYTAYKIMPSLQLHQLRVAAVAKYLCGKLSNSLDERSTILACLFHDMGNIVKSNFDILPDLTEPEGKEYWEGVKADFIEKYGEISAHEVNLAIARAIGLPGRSLELIDGLSFSNMTKIAESADMEQKVCEYADMRVGPYGILGMEERLKEARERYLASKSGKSYYTDDGFFSLVESARRIEAQIVEAANISSSEISDESVGGHIEGLREYHLS